MGASGFKAPGPPLMLRNIHAVALNTFREAIRDRILHVLLVGGVVMILGSYAIGYAGIPTESAENTGANAAAMQPYIHNRNKIIMDVGLGTMWVLNVVICVFIGTGMIHKEIDKRTLFTVLTKPIDRYEFILGKYFGLAATVLMLCLSLSAIFLLYVYAIVGTVEPALWQEVALLCLELLFITAIAITYGAISTPVLSAVLTIFTVFIGENVNNIVELGRVGGMKENTGWLYAIKVVLPNLARLNNRNDAVMGFMQSWPEFGGGVAYTACYCTVLLVIACWAFRNRSF